jgi:L,D-peptidoglycan transpeptidase YkuD (ErfK/YbiS/YcfS/YnhG family)
MPADDDIRILSSNRLAFKGRVYACAIGRNGFTSAHREGDGATPLGRFPLRGCLYRDDRTPPPATCLALLKIEPQDGWCDDPDSPWYNRPVRLPFASSHERLAREDHVYDLIVPLGFNDAPVIAGRGSAIFFHLAHDDYRPTEGCVAVSLPDMLEILSCVTPQTQMRIEPAGRQ